MPIRLTVYKGLLNPLAINDPYWVGDVDRFVLILDDGDMVEGVEGVERVFNLPVQTAIVVWSRNRQWDGFIVYGGFISGEKNQLRLFGYEIDWVSRFKEHYSFEQYHDACCDLAETTHTPKRVASFVLKIRANAQELVEGLNTPALDLAQRDKESTHTSDTTDTPSQNGKPPSSATHPHPQIFDLTQNKVLCKIYC